MKEQIEIETVPITTVIVTIFFKSPFVSVTEKKKKKSIILIFWALYIGKKSYNKGLLTYFLDQVLKTL